MASDLTQVTLMSDGVSVYECTSDDEVIDLLRGGQGVFCIALGGVWRSIEGTCPSCRPSGPTGRPPTAQDELSRRRQARASRLSSGAPPAVQSRWERPDPRGGVDRGDSSLLAASAGRQKSRANMARGRS